MHKILSCLCVVQHGSEWVNSHRDHSDRHRPNLRDSPLNDAGPDVNSFNGAWLHHELRQSCMDVLETGLRNRAGWDGGKLGDRHQRSYGTGWLGEGRGAGGGSRADTCTDDGGGN